MFTFVAQDKAYVIIFFVIVIISLIYTIKLLRSNDKSSIKPSNPCLFSSDEKGAYGENLIRSDLEKLSGKQKICSNVYLPKGNGETSDLDKVICRDNLILDTEGSLYFKLRDRFKNSEKIFSENVIIKIYNIFNEYCNVSEEIKNKHVQDIIRRRGK